MLTDRQIQAATKAGAPEVILTDDTGTRGQGRLMLVVRNGSAVWYGRWYENGKRQKMTLGRYPALGLKEARDKYSQIVAPKVAQGVNPKVIVTPIEQPTLEALFKGYVGSLKEKGRVSATEFERSLLLGKYNAADAIGRHKIAADVKPEEVSAFLAKTFRRGARGQADKVRTYMCAAFNWGIKSTHDYTIENRRDWGIKFNPVQMVKKDAQAIKVGERNLSADEIRQLWRALDAGGFFPETAAAIKLIICCGQRVQETLKADGCEIDFKSKTWNMPAAKTKMKTAPHSVPIPDMAIPIFKQLVAVHGDGMLFPSRKHKDEVMDFCSINRAIARWCDQTGFAKFTPRDLRRTWKSRTGEIGIDRFTRDLIQQHAMGDTGSKHYDRANYLPKMREAMNQWNKWLAKTV